MTGWNCSPRIPTRLTRWINFVHAALRQWSQPFRRLHDDCLALSHVRRRWPVLLSLEPLEVRVLLDAAPTLLNDLTQLRNDLATSAVALVNAVQPSPTNPPTLASIEIQASKVWNTLTTDWNQTWQAFVQVEYAALGAAQQMFDILLEDLDKQLGIAPQSPPPPAPNTNGRSQQSSGLLAPPPAPTVDSSGTNDLPAASPAFVPSDPQTSSSISLTSSANPSQSGQSVTFTAMVSGSTPTGTVTFLDGTTVGKNDHGV